MDHRLLNEPHAVLNRVNQQVSFGGIIVVLVSLSSPASAPAEPSSEDPEEHVVLVTHSAPPVTD